MVANQRIGQVCVKAKAHHVCKDGCADDVAGEQVGFVQPREGLVVFSPVEVGFVVDGIDGKAAQRDPLQIQIGNDRGDAGGGIDRDDLLLCAGPVVANQRICIVIKTIVDRLVGAYILGEPCSAQHQ